MTAVRNNIASTAEGKIAVEIVDSQNAQPTQNDQVDAFLSKRPPQFRRLPVEGSA